MSPEDIKKKIEELQKRHNAVVQDRAGRQGELKAKKEELAAIVTEIRAAGLEPKNLAEEHAKAQKELEAMIADYETALSAVELALTEYNKKAS